MHAYISVVCCLDGAGLTQNAILQSCYYQSAFGRLQSVHLSKDSQDFFIVRQEPWLASNVFLDLWWMMKQQLIPLLESSALQALTQCTRSATKLAFIDRLNRCAGMWKHDITQKTWFWDNSIFLHAYRLIEMTSLWWTLNKDYSYMQCAVFSQFSEIRFIKRRDSL